MEEDEPFVVELREKLEKTALKLLTTKSDYDDVYDKWKVCGYVLSVPSC